MARKAKTYVLDTNVLIHDPSALFRFMEHHLYVPMVVLEELDAIKKGPSEVARNARQASRYLDEIIGQADAIAIADGLPLRSIGDGGDLQRPLGKLYLQTQALRVEPALLIAGNTPDNSILETVLELKRRDCNGEVTLVSKDINLNLNSHAFALGNTPGAWRNSSEVMIHHKL